MAQKNNRKTMKLTREDRNRLEFEREFMQLIEEANELTRSYQPTIGVVRSDDDIFREEEVIAELEALGINVNE